jgi:hypothetical protein
MLNDKELLEKAESDEGLTVEEIMRYQELVKPVVHTYGKYGTLAKIYLEEHNPAKYWGLGGNVPEYLHGIDKQAADMYEAIYEKLSKSEQFKRTGVFLKDLQIETEKKRIIDEEILNELVYAD